MAYFTKEPGGQITNVIVAKDGEASLTTVKAVIDGHWRATGTGGGKRRGLNSISYAYSIPKCSFMKVKTMLTNRKGSEPGRYTLFIIR